MKKIIKNNILGFIIGAVLFSGITVYATKYLAGDITYKDTNVEEALNDLYENSKNIDGTEKYHNSAYSDVRYATNSVTLAVPKGKFICNFSYVSSSAHQTQSKHESTISTHSYEIEGCNEKNIINNSIKSQFAQTIFQGTYYNGFILGNVNFICETNDESTIKASFNIDGINSNNFISTGREITCNKIG